jgi:hypothetical protein
MKKDNIVGIVVRIVLLCGMLLCLGIACLNTFHSVRSPSWPTAKGVIIESRVERKRSESGKSKSYARIQYQYSLNGSKHTSKRVQFAVFGSRSGDTAHRLVSKYPKGSEVDVHYDPNKPARAVLEPGFRWTILLQFLFAAIFGFVGIIVPMWCRGDKNTEQETERDK